MVKLMFALIILLLFIWRIRKGFSNGMMQEIVTLVSGLVALVCVVLVMLAASSVMARAMGTLTFCVAGLILLGIAFKLCSLIFKPILALSNLSVIGSFNRFLGAAMGAAEACVLSCAIYYVFDFIGICVL